MPPDEFLTPDEIGRKFKVKPDTVRGWVRDGRIRAIRLGSNGRRGPIRIAASDVERFITDASKEAE